MRAGKLDQRITLEQPTEARDPNYGTLVKTWVAVATVWAAVEPQSGREYLTNEEPGAELALRVRIRYGSHVAACSPKWRVNYGGRLLQINAVINLRSAGEELQLICTEYRQG
jgi:SPP1 family predicted phage head-tail adaptor